MSYSSSLGFLGHTFDGRVERRDNVSDRNESKLNWPPSRLSEDSRSRPLADSFEREIGIEGAVC